MKWLSFLALSIWLLACSTDDQQTSFLEVRLTDAPGDFESVNIDIQGVEVHSGENDDSGWKSLDVQSGVYDLLKLTNGLDTLLATAELPSGQISQIRLVLGENNSVEIDGDQISLSTPSAQQSGLKLNLHTNLQAGIKYILVLDFDAARSIVKSGAEKYSLKPVLRSIATPDGGSISGVIEPLESAPTVYAIMGSDTLASTGISDTGEFLIRGLPVGTYTISFEPQEGFESVEKSVEVMLGVLSNMGTITIL